MNRPVYLRDCVYTRRPSGTGLNCSLLAYLSRTRTPPSALRTRYSQEQHRGALLSTSISAVTEWWQRCFGPVSRLPNYEKTWYSYSSQQFETGTSLRVFHPYMGSPDPLDVESIACMTKRHRRHHGSRRSQRLTLSSSPSSPSSVVYIWLSCS